MQELMIFLLSVPLLIVSELPTVSLDSAGLVIGSASLIDV